MSRDQWREVARLAWQDRATLAGFAVQLVTVPARGMIGGAR